MGVFRNFPYSNFHEMNLDEIIKIMRELEDEWTATKAEWKSYKDFIDNYFANLNLDAETEKALRKLLAEGSLDSVIDPVIIEEVTKWLNNHISQPTTPVVDNTLTIAGAASDAYVTGNRITKNKRAIGSDIDNVQIASATLVPGAYEFPTQQINTSVASYYHLMYTLQNEPYVYVTGFAFSGGFGLWGFLDSNGNVIDYDVSHSSGTFEKDVYLEIPQNAVTLIVNASITPNNKERYVYILRPVTTLSELVSRDPATNVFSDAIEMDGSLTLGKAYNFDGSEGSAPVYQYKEVTLNGGETLLITGFHYSNDYPAFIVFDSNNTIVYRYLHTSNAHIRNFMLTMPSNASKIIINGRSTNNADTHFTASARKIQFANNIIDYKKKRKYLFIGDSYGEGYTHDEHNDGWIAYCAEYMGLSANDYKSVYQGGYGFGHASLNFTNLTPNTDPMDEYTDIVVCGGYNDNSYTEQQILKGIPPFINKCRIAYPNADIHIGFIAWNKAGSGSGAEANWQTIHENLINVVMPAYKKCIEYGVSYLNNVELWINDAGLSTSDGYHPNEAGNRSIARAIANALLTGSAPMPYNPNNRL